MVFQVLAYKFIKVLSNYKSFIANSVHYAGDKDHIVVSLFLAFRVKYHLHYFFGNAKQFDALINQILFKVGGELLDLVKLPGLVFLQLLQKLLGVSDIIVNFHLSIGQPIGFVIFVVNCFIL